MYWINKIANEPPIVRILDCIISPYLGRLYVLGVLFMVVFFFLDMLHIFGLGAGNQMRGELKISIYWKHGTATKSSITTRSLNIELEE
jgi:hypothetical protein